MWVIIPAVLAMAGLVAIPLLVRKKSSRERTVIPKQSAPSWITRQGVEVYAGGLALNADEVEDAIGTAMGWWIGYAPGKTAAITRHFAEASLYLVAKGPLVLPSGRLVNGFTDGLQLVVWANEAMALTLMHECGHLAMAAMGENLSGDEQHARMREIAFPWS